MKDYSIVLPESHPCVPLSVIKNGTVIKLKSYSQPLVCIHESNCSDTDCVLPHRKNIADDTSFQLFYGMWYKDDASILTSGAYGKYHGKLTRGRFNDIEAVYGCVTKFTNFNTVI